MKLLKIVAILFISLATLISIATYTTASLQNFTDGLDTFYCFNVSGTTNSDCYGSYPLEAVAGLTHLSSGGYYGDGSVNFTGDNQHLRSSNYSFFNIDLTENKTFLSIANYDNSLLTGVRRVIFGKGQELPWSANKKVGYWIGHATTDELFFLVTDGSNYYENYSITDLSGLSGYHMTTLTFDADNDMFHLYLDDVEVFNYSVSGWSSLSNDQDFQIYDASSHNNRNWRGDVDSVLAYTSLFDSSDVSRFWNSSNYYSNEAILSDAGEGGSPSLSSGVSVAINLTFDNESDPWKDYSVYDHTFTNTSGLVWCDRNTAKWYGGACNNDSSNNGYLTTTADFNIDESGFGWEFWVYMENSPSGSVRPGFLWSHTGGDGLSSGEDNQGLNMYWYNDTGSKVGSYYSYANVAESGTWYHYAFYYDDNDCSQNWFVNGNYANRSGCLNTSIVTSGLAFDVLRGKYWNTGADYVMDEFLFYNSSSGLSRSYFNDSYQAKISGTPPDIDYFISSVKYDLPFNWSDPYNALEKGGVMPINFTIKNEGVVTNGNTSNYILYLDGNTICSGNFQLDTEQSTTISCNWTTSQGIKKGWIAIDSIGNTTEDVETNNNITIYVPFLDKPYFHFNLSEWNDVIVPYASNSSHQVAYDDYTWTSYGGCSAFNDGYDGDSVDPYGKYARTCAMSCLVNNYSGYGCSQALVQLEGWSNRTVTSYDNVQNIHELIHVGIAYDIMFPNLTQTQAETWGSRFEDICQQITNLPNTRPDLDNSDSINGGNGQGFSSGFAGFCYSILGMDAENPSMLHVYPQQYYGGNLLDSWMKRETNFIRSYKNDSNALYEEGNSYMAYALYHFVDNAYYHQRNGLLDFSIYQNALNAIGKEWLTQTMDFTYNGDTIRNDRSRYMRMIQRGDSRSYIHPSDGSILNCAVITLSGLSTNDNNIKKGILWLRNKTNSVGDCDTVDGFADLYLYGILANQVNNTIPNSVTGLLNNLSFDSANDIVTLRTGYSYNNDTIIQIDGGEERMNGHSVASGYYLYALGEPFFDYQQVPYEDDTRSEAWTNGISLQNDTQTVEGQSSYYNSQCNVAELNQYYGMSDCTAPSFSTDYPDYRVLPINRGGDVEQVFASDDAKYMTTYVYRPYYLSSNVREYFVKVDDVLIKFTTLENVTQGEGIYHNFLNLNPEFNFSNDGINFTLQRTGTNKKVNTNLVYSNQTISLDENPTNLTACFGKTDCTSSYRSNQTYRRTYYYTNSTNLDLIITHHWYENNTNKSIVSINSQGDQGVQIDTKKTYFDTDDSGIITADNFITDADTLTIINSTNYMVSAATYVIYNSTIIYNSTQNSFITSYTYTPSNTTQNDTEDEEQQTSGSGSSGGSSSSPSSLSKNNLPTNNDLPTQIIDNAKDVVDDAKNKIKNIDINLPQNLNEVDFQEEAKNIGNNIQKESTTNKVLLVIAIFLFLMAIGGVKV